MKNPKYYIHTKWEKIEGYRYEQPVRYCNDVELTVNVIKNFDSIFGVDFSKTYKESSAYKEALISCNYDSEFWENEDIKIKAFNKIYEFILGGKSGTSSSITPLFPFEIYLMNDGFEMINFCELNAINPGTVLYFGKVVKEFNGHALREVALPSLRSYRKGDKIIEMRFGVNRINFVFSIRDKGVLASNNYFQVDNNIDNYQKAIEGGLKSII